MRSSLTREHSMALVLRLLEFHAYANQFVRSTWFLSNTLRRAISNEPVDFCTWSLEGNVHQMALWNSSCAAQKSYLPPPHICPDGRRSQCESRFLQITFPAPRTSALPPSTQQRPEDRCFAPGRWWRACRSKPTGRSPDLRRHHETAWQLSRGPRGSSLQRPAAERLMLERGVTLEKAVLRHRRTNSGLGRF